MMLVNLAFAVDIVLYAPPETPEQAVYATSRDLGTPPYGLVPVTLSAAVAGRPPSYLGGNQLPCDGPPVTNAALREQVAKAEGRITYGQEAQALSELTAASNALPCLNEPAEASLLGRLYFLRGLVDTDSAATLAFRAARAAQPKLEWDTRFPPDRKPVFDAAVASPAPVFPVDTFPGVAQQGGLWVNGRLQTLPLSLPAGQHVVQRLGTSVVTWVIEPSPNAALVVPSALQDADLRALSDTQRTHLTTLLRGSDRYFALIDGTVFRVSDWQPLARQRPASEPICTVRRRCVGQALTFTGVGLVGSGAGLLSWGALAVSGTTASPDGESNEAYQQRLGRREAYGALLPAGGVIAGLGLGVGLVGLVLQADRPQSVSVRLSADSLAMTGSF